MSAAPTTQRTVILQDDALRRIEGFTQIPNVVLKHPGISYGAKVAFGVLLSYAWQDDFCFPAQDRLARDLNCSVRQVQRLLKELKDGAFVDWRQQGLNRPNIYYILPIARWKGSKSAIHEDTTDLSYPSATDPSRLDATHSSFQETTDPSPKEDAMKKIQTNVNVTSKDSSGFVARTLRNPTISEAALVNHYGFSQGQVHETRSLVEFQIEVLGAAERNHAAYVKRAAQAVRDSTTNVLRSVLGEIKDTSQRKAIGSLPAYFTRVYDAARDGALRADGQLTTSVKSNSLSDEDLRDIQRDRLLQGIAAKGYAIPAHIQRASLSEIAAWCDEV